MVYILYGPDTYSINKELENIKKSLGEADMLSVNTSVLDGNEVTVQEIKDTCCTAPFLNSFRLVIVEGFIGHFVPEVKKRQDQKNNSAKRSGKSYDSKALVEVLRQVPSTAVLIFIENAITTGNTLLKLLTPLAETRYFPLLKKAELIEWIGRKIQSEEGKISPGAIKILIDLVGNDLWALSNEIDKLLSYSHGRVISETDVKEITSYSREISIFNVVDSIIEKHLGEAQVLVKRMVKEGANSSYILTMILRQLRLIVKAKYLERGISESEALARLELHSEFALNKTIKQAKTYSMQQLQSLYEKLLDLDVNIKTGKYVSDIEIDLMIFEMCRRS